MKSIAANILQAMIGGVAGMAVAEECLVNVVAGLRAGNTSVEFREGFSEGFEGPRVMEVSIEKLTGDPDGANVGGQGNVSGDNTSLGCGRGVGIP